MVNTIHPVDVVVATGLPTFGGRQLRQVGSVAFAGASAADPFGGRSGVRPGTSATTVTATSTTWTVGPHAGLLDFEAAVESGPTPYAIDAAVTGAMRAADAFARVDLIWVRQDIPLEDGSAAPAVVPGYTYGTVAAPTLPTLPNTRCMVLAWINVPASGGGSPTVTWKAPYTLAAGVLPSVIYAGNNMGAALTSGTFYAISSWTTTINKSVTITGTHTIPLEPGYYRAKVRAQWNPNEFGLRFASVNLNSGGTSTTGQLTAASENAPPVSTTPYSFNQETDSLVSMNGTTDYIEVFVMQSSGYTVNVNVFVELTLIAAP